MEKLRGLKMMCEICGSEDGRIKYTKVINGEKVEFFICEDCAKQKGFQPLISPSEELDEGGEKRKEVKKYKCPRCGWKLIDIEKKAKLGCPECYKMFKAQMITIVGELHGESKHKGKAPVHDKRKLILRRRIREVKKALDDALKKEEYQLAAELRDKIKTLSLKMEENE
jgi:protein arginine kinase activator